jgi:RimJ/RimL family protein N-acetyltransferase
MNRTTYFETPRLVARAFRSSDVEAFVAYRSDPEIARFQSWSDYTSELGTALIEAMQRAEPGVPGEWYQFALEDRVDGTLVGDVALRVDESEPRMAEVGVTLASGQQGKGYGAEALRGLFRYAFDRFSLHRIVAVTDALNTPAASLLERVGMRREGHLVENVFFKGAWGSEFLFAILESEWAAER